MATTNCQNLFDRILVPVIKKAPSTWNW